MQSEARGPQFNDVQLNHKFPVFFQIRAQKTHSLKGNIMKAALPTIGKDVYSTGKLLPCHKVTKSPYRLA